MTKNLSFALFLTALAVMTNGPAFALVGASAPGGALASAVVMVLNRWAGGAGFCSGIVIAQNIVLTAAHCLAAPKDMRIHFRDESGQPVLMDIEASAVHPLYRAEAQKTRERSIDLALLRTALPLPARFHAARLDDGTAIAIGSRFRVAGFGVTQEGAGTSAGELRVGLIEARAPRSPILLWGGDPAHAGTGACTGDSGAPIFAATSDIVVAVVDWATGTGPRHCGDVTQAALVAPQRGWIASVLRGWGMKNPP
jgi:secreted trypsin-like serine protease